MDSKTFKEFCDELDLSLMVKRPLDKPYNYYFVYRDDEFYFFKFHKRKDSIHELRYRIIETIKKELLNRIY